jgi:hypothetical protein
MRRDLAIGVPPMLEGWAAARGKGIRAVVDIDDECSTVGGMVRENGMRDLRLPLSGAGLPDPEELHIATSWVQERLNEGGAVLLHDASVRGNDGVLGCAVLVKQGKALESALGRLRSISSVPLSQAQMSLLHQFVAQRSLSTAR